MRVDRKLPARDEPHFVTASLERAEKSSERAVRFIASDESVDRYGDIVKSDWDLRNFKRNPVFLWNHDRDAPAVGSVDPIAVEGRKLMATANFVAPGVDDFADKLWRLIEAKVLNAVSVGFTVEPENVERIVDSEGDYTGGFRYHAPELLEISLVNVPANPHAVLLGRSLGLSADQLSRVLVSDALVTQRQHIAKSLLRIRVREKQLFRPR